MPGENLDSCDEAAASCADGVGEPAWWLILRLNLNVIRGSKVNDPVTASLYDLLPLIACGLEAPVYAYSFVSLAFRSPSQPSYFASGLNKMFI